MKIYPVSDPKFIPYGKVIADYDVSEFLETLRGTTVKPNDVIYVPSDPTLEALPVINQLRDNFYGGMPIQVGYCNGYNRTLNCLEYHRGSELNITANDIALLLAPLQSIYNGHISTAEVTAFLAPAGTLVQLYETTLHYAPCCAASGDSFRVAIVLPKGTNTEKPASTPCGDEDKLLWARNKWLLAHSESNEAKMGAYVGLIGENVTLKNLRIP